MLRSAIQGGKVSKVSDVYILFVLFSCIGCTYQAGSHSEMKGREETSDTIMDG